MFNIVLVEPEIPQNTGNISRTCAATHSVLHLVRPLGFEISDRTLKRAGLDYCQYLDVEYYDSFDELYEKYSAEANFYFLSTKGAGIILKRDPRHKFSLHVKDLIFNYFTNFLYRFNIVHFIRPFLKFKFFRFVSEIYPLKPPLYDSNGSTSK